MARFREARSQSAMEYLMTYGWAILIVAVVLGALYSLGIFNGVNFLGGTCVAAPGYLCGNPLLSTGGTLSFTYGYQGPNVTVVGFACTNTTTAPSSFASSGSSNLEPGQEESVSVSCPLSSGATIGTPYSGYLWVEYDQAGQSDLIARFATVRLSASIEGKQYIYCIQGDSSDFGVTNMVAAAQISGTTVNPWIVQPPTGNYPIANWFGSCASSGSNIYCVGGGNGAGTNRVYSTSVTGASASSWQPQSTYPLNIYQDSCTASSSDIYCIGGQVAGTPTNMVAAATISGTAVGPWVVQTTGNYPVADWLESCTYSNSYLYCVGGGAFGEAINSIYVAPVSGTTVGQWVLQPSTSDYPLPSGIFGQPCVISGSTIYCIAGFTGVVGVNAVYAAPISGTSVGQWVPQSPTGNYPLSVGYFPCTSEGPDIYCIGGYAGGPASQTTYTTSVSGTSVSPWTQAQTSYPAGDIAGQSCIVTQS